MSFFDMNSRKMIYAQGVLTGMVIIASPHIIGASILLGMLALTIKLVDKNHL